jgi:hypothetical protein
MVIRFFPPSDSPRLQETLQIFNLSQVKKKIKSKMLEIGSGRSDKGLALGTMDLIIITINKGKSVGKWTKKLPQVT